MTNPFDFERAAGKLGQQAADSFDVERAAEGVVRRLRVVERPWWSAHAVLQAAAAVAIVAGGALVVARNRTPEIVGSLAAATESGVLDQLSPGELVEMLDSLALEAPPSSHVGRGLHDLTEAQLKELLQSEG